MAKESQFFKSKLLQDKIVRSNKIITIGIMGASYGCGSSHLSFSLASYFNKMRTKVGLVEWREQTSFVYIEEAYEGLKKAVHTREFKIKNITFYKDYFGEISGLKEKGNQLIIVDFGPYKHAHIPVMNNLDIQIIVAHGDEWKCHELYHILHSEEMALFYNWKVVVPFGNKEEIKSINRKTKLKTYTFGYHKDPFLWTKELKGEVEKILDI